MDDAVDCVVIGAGVVGLAVARSCALAGRSTILVERQRQFGTGISSRNSGVIHSGIHNAPGTLKSTLCLRGAALLREYCAGRHVPHSLCGKLIIATGASELPRLAALHTAALDRGIPGARMLGPEELRRLEPALAAQAAIHLPAVGVVDAHALMGALLADFESAGGSFLLQNEVTAVARAGEGFVVRVTGSAAGLNARALVNAAGLDAPALARRIEGLPPASIPPLHLAKGNYFQLNGRSPFRQLVYPLPVDGGLGVHLTLDIDGRARFGPDVEWIEAIDYGVAESRAEAFYVAIRRYWPGLPDGALSPAYAGIRPKLSGPGMPPADFCIQDRSAHGVAGLVCLYGIESPGLTAALAIAEQVRDRLGAHT